MLVAYKSDSFAGVPLIDILLGLTFLPSAQYIWSQTANGPAKNHGQPHPLVIPTNPVVNYVRRNNFFVGVQELVTVKGCIGVEFDHMSQSGNAPKAASRASGYWDAEHEAVHA